jgi:site-specific DNA-cytosine methylase
MRLVLSLFSGVGALDEGFRRAGFCVVSAGDVAWGSLYDLRHFHPPQGVFDGVIGGDPCQSHSSLANLVRAKGLEPSFPDMTPELCRVVEEARPRWFLRENVPKAPEIKPAGYDVANFLLDNWASLGEEQSRRRRFWFGVWGGPVPELRKYIRFAVRPPDEFALAVNTEHGHLDGSERIAKRRKQTVVTNQFGHRATADGKSHVALYSLDEMLDLQGLPRDLFEHSPLTMRGKRKFVGNAVTLPMAVALANAVSEAMS